MKIIKFINDVGAKGLLKNQYYSVKKEDQQYYTTDNAGGGWYKDRYQVIYDDGNALVDDPRVLVRRLQPHVCIVPIGELVLDQVYFLTKEFTAGADELVNVIDSKGQETGISYRKDRFQRVGDPLKDPRDVIAAISNTKNEVSVEDLQRDHVSVMSEILRIHQYTPSAVNIDHMSRMDQDFLKYLSSSWDDFDRIAHDAQYWTLQYRNNKELRFQIPNPTSESLSQGNLIVQENMNRRIKDNIKNPQKYHPQKHLQEEKKDMSKYERKKLGMEVVRALPNNDSYIFGGFVRDYITGDEFGDMDIVLNGNFCKGDFISNLKGLGLKPMYRETLKSYDDDTDHEIYVVNKDGKAITLDIISNAIGGVRINNPIKPDMWDADVNQVFMRKDGSMGAGFGYRGTFDSLKKKIENKEYTALPGLTTARQTKLSNKGYYPTGAKRPETKTPDMKDELKMEKSTLPQTQVLTKPSFMDKLKGNAEEAAYRVAATQMTTGTKAAILAIMEKQGQGSERIAAIAEMLDTEVGSALVAGLLGLGLAYAPMVSGDPRAQRLADEFQVAGMATVGNAVVGIAMEHFVPVVMGALSTLPQPTVKQMRVATREEEKALSTPTIELEDNSATPQPAAKSANAAR